MEFGAEKNLAPKKFCQISFDIESINENCKKSFQTKKCTGTAEISYFLSTLSDQVDRFQALAHFSNDGQTQSYEISNGLEHQKMEQT